MSANIVSVDEESLRMGKKNLVRKTVEETLDALLDEESLRMGKKNLVRKTVEETLDALLDEESSGLVGV